MGEGLNKPLFSPKMSTDVLYFSFSRSALVLTLSLRSARELADVFEKNENKRTSVYRLYIYV